VSVVTLSKKDIILPVRKLDCALGLELGLGLADIRFDQMCFRGSVVDPITV